MVIMRAQFVISLIIISAICSALENANSLSDDCQTTRNKYSSDKYWQLAVQALAKSEVAIVTEPVAQGGIDMRNKVAKIRIACLLKGRPDAKSLKVNLLPTGEECVDQVQMEGVLEEPVNRTFVLMLHRPAAPESKGSWDLLDGGLYAADRFLRTMSDKVCNLSRLYDNSCRSYWNSGPGDAVGCLPFHTMALAYRAKEKQPYLAAEMHDGGDSDSTPVVDNGSKSSLDSTGLLNDHPLAVGAKSSEGNGNGGSSVAAAPLLLLALLMAACLAGCLSGDLAC